MTKKIDLYLPQDDLVDDIPNFDVSADYLELDAFFSRQSCAFLSSMTSALEISSEIDREDSIAKESAKIEEIVSGTLEIIRDRSVALGNAYPFIIRENDDVLEYIGNDLSYFSMNYALGRAAYVISLVLSNLKSMSPILSGSKVYPTDADIQLIRTYFQYFATAAMAAVVSGQAWSFDFPRYDGTGFHEKMEEIWNILGDGELGASPDASSSPKDGGIDVFAAQVYPDKLPGFLLAAGQVATGKDWKDKSIYGLVNGVFQGRWFSRPPVTRMVFHHIVPFARPKKNFPDDCRVLGNVIHRLRLPSLVVKAHELRNEKNLSIEAFEELGSAVDWVRDYADRASCIS